MSSEPRKQDPCLTCPVKGLLPEVCTIHRKQMKGRSPGGYSLLESKWTGIGVTLAAGAGMGLAGSVAVLAVAPALGAKAALGHMLGYQIAGAASATGAGIGAGIRLKKTEAGAGRQKRVARTGLRNRYTRIPYTLPEQGRDE
ncbi:MAG: hypothetical protein MI863_09795 [Desulfobacterales bacterium]|nr:hypothetical protein [Desulfobacterales bacterium]